MTNEPSGEPDSGEDTRVTSAVLAASAAIAFACPHCGQRGTMMRGFGPAAEAADADVLPELIDKRDDMLPGNSAPGEEATATSTIGPRHDPISAEDRLTMRANLENFIRRKCD